MCQIIHVTLATALTCSYEKWHTYILVHSIHEKEASIQMLLHDTSIDRMTVLWIPSITLMDEATCLFLQRRLPVPNVFPELKVVVSYVYDLVSLATSLVIPFVY